MKRNLRLGGCHALIQKATKDFLCVQTLAQAPAHPGPGLAIGVIMFLMPLAVSHTAYARQQHQAADRVAGSGDTSRTMKDTLLLEEVQINAGYYTVKDRERTGSIGRVDGKTIARQPVGNPLAALHGQVPGVEVTQQSGAPGATVSLRIRGTNSLLNGSDPLFIIDGVPFMAGQQPINQLASISSRTTVTGTTAGISPLALLSPADIASIEVLKDADATAIYGSRGANGVVLITTHRATQQDVRINAQYRTGLSRPTRLVDMLSGPEYLAMRREAFANDGVEIDAAAAPDLVLWDTASPTDFTKLLLPERARYNDAQLTLSGGGPTANFLVSGTYGDESTVFDRRTASRRFGLHATGGLQNATGSFRLDAAATIGNTAYKLPVNDVTRYLRFNPFFPVYDDEGDLAWDINGTPFRNIAFADGNPVAMQYRNYESSLTNLITRLSVGYDIIGGLTFKTDIGTTMTFRDEWNAVASAAIDAYSSSLPSASFSSGRLSGWTVEPQLSYRYEVGRLGVSALLGGTWQDQSGESVTNSGTNYASDIMLRSVSAAGNISTSDQTNRYRYQGWYTRLNANISGRYIVNLTGRRDGSSRFSPENRYAAFGAIGGAWLLDAEPFMQWARWLDLAKLRASYGITGNDQIGDYRYIDTWATGYQTYEGNAVLNPVSLYNRNYVWERNRKFEIGFESGMFGNKIQVQAGYFRNVSDNQLVQYTLPVQTGFNNVLRNHQATILNAGWELLVGYSTNGKSALRWHTSINTTLPVNRLLAFPDLATSSYRNRFVLGEAVTTRLGYRYLGVDPQTGLYDYVDADGNGVFNTADAIFPVRMDMKLYGGWNNTIVYKQWSLAATVDFKLQDGYNYKYGMGNNVPGANYSNHPVLVLKRWQNAGDKTDVQRFTATRGEAFQRATLLSSSNGVISDASYARLRNVSVGYALPERLAKTMGLANCRLSCQAQNLVTLTTYEGTDPESQAFYTLPPMRTVTFSIELGI